LIRKKNNIFNPGIFNDEKDKNKIITYSRELLQKVNCSLNDEVSKA